MKSISILGIGGTPTRLPTGGSGGARGFVGPVQAGIFWRVLAEVDSIKYNEDVPEAERIHPASRQPKGAWWQYFFEGYEEAKACAQAFEARNPNMMWHAHVDLSEVINLTEEGKANFHSDSIVGEVQVKSWRSKLYRHQFQLIALPATVAAVAKLLDMTDVGYDLSALTEQNVVFDDALYARLCGHPDAGKQDEKAFGSAIETYIPRGVDGSMSYWDAVRAVRSDAAVRASWRYCELFEQRTSLWLALGESDPEAYNLPVPGSTSPGRYEVTSPQLAECISFVIKKWSAPVWCRLLWVPDPKVDETFEIQGEAKRRNLFAITEIFLSEADARAAVGDMNEPTTATPTAHSRPPLPTAWKPLGEAVFAEELANVANLPAVLAASKLSITPEELTAWRNLLSSPGEVVDEIPF